MKEDNSTSYRIELRSKKDTSTILFIFIWLIIILIKIINSDEKIFSNLVSQDLLLISLVTLITSILIHRLCWIFTGKVKLFIDEDLLTVKKYTLNFSTTKNYKLKEIKNLKIEKESNSTSFWGIKGLRLYDKESNLLYFEYNYKQNYIGAGLKDFDAINLKKEIEKKRG